MKRFATCVALGYLCLLSALPVWAQSAYSLTILPQASWRDAGLDLDQQGNVVGTANPEDNNWLNAWGVIWKAGAPEPTAIPLPNGKGRVVPRSIRGGYVTGEYYENFNSKAELVTWSAESGTIRVSEAFPQHAGLTQLWIAGGKGTAVVFYQYKGLETALPALYHPDLFPEDGFKLIRGITTETFPYVWVRGMSENGRVIAGIRTPKEDSSTSEAFVKVKNSAHSLGTLPGGKYVEVTAVSPDGRWVAGIGFMAGIPVYSHAGFLIRSNAPGPLVALKAGEWHILPASVNNQGLVLGTAVKYSPKHQSFPALFDSSTGQLINLEKLTGRTDLSYLKLAGKKILVQVAGKRVGVITLR